MVVQWLVLILVGIVGWFIRRTLNDQDEKLDEILVEVRATNGDVITLKEWKKNHEKSIDTIHEGFRSDVKALWETIRNIGRQT